MPLRHAKQQWSNIPSRHISWPRWHSPHACQHILLRYPRRHPSRWSPQLASPWFQPHKCKDKLSNHWSWNQLKDHKISTPSILDHLFNQLCPGYSKEPHVALDHIWQTYKDASGNTIFSSVSDYCTQILTAYCLFIDQEELPISICQAFMDGLDSCLLAGFCTHFHDFGKLQAQTATHQRQVFHEMLQATIHAKMEYTNIRTIASEAIGIGQAVSTQVNASQAEKTVSKYKSRDEGPNKSSSTASCGQLCCYNLACITLG